MNVVRLVWGKAWNIPGVVAAISERLEQFTASGVPRRSWLRMRLLRVAERVEMPAGSSPPMETSRQAKPADESGHAHELLGGGCRAEDRGGLSGERLDQLAMRYYGDPAPWRVIAEANGLADPFQLPAGTVLRIPPRRSS
jgi:hypothetical protein